MKKVILTLVGFTTLLMSALIGWTTTEIFAREPDPISTTAIIENPQVSSVDDQPVPSVSAVSSDVITKQQRLLNMAYQIGKENGFDNPEIIQAILLKETLAGGMESYKVSNPGPNAYFGLMQIKLVAAKEVLARSPELFARHNFHTRTNEEIRANLILNERFNIEVATKYLLILKHEYGFSGRQLLNAYNRGPTGVRSVGDNYHYAIGAERRLAAWQQNN
ncbi:MAG: hypothetical protein DDT31_00050 [Syntrophomonadaceae bacterium]|nr:hypothetical protein [Bacillota bacterium]